MSYYPTFPDQYRHGSTPVINQTGTPRVIESTRRLERLTGNVFAVGGRVARPRLASYLAAADRLSASHVSLNRIRPSRGVARQRVAAGRGGGLLLSFGVDLGRDGSD